MSNKGEFSFDRDLVEEVFENNWCQVIDDITKMVNKGENINSYLVDKFLEREEEIYQYDLSVGHVTEELNRNEYEEYIDRKIEQAPPSAFLNGEAFRKLLQKPISK